MNQSPIPHITYRAYRLALLLNLVLLVVNRYAHIGFYSFYPTSGKQNRLQVKYVGTFTLWANSYISFNCHNGVIEATSRCETDYDIEFEILLTSLHFEAMELEYIVVYTSQRYIERSQSQWVNYVHANAFDIYSINKLTYILKLWG